MVYPLLKPETTIVAFCSENDVIKHDRIATPGIPLYYQTNLGFVISNIPYEICSTVNQVLPTIEDAYSYYAKLLFADTSSGILSFLSSRLLFTNDIYLKYNRKVFLGEGSEEFGFNFQNITHRHLQAIKETADNENAVLTIVFIPDYFHVEDNYDELRYKNEFSDVFFKPA